MALSSQASGAPLADMNITPLVDVMLVMLVIFMITAPMLTTPIPVPLNGKPPSVTERPPVPIELRIDAAGGVFVDGQSVPMSVLSSMFSAEAERAGERPPMLKIEANGAVEYEVVTKVLAIAENSGLRNIAVLP